MNRQNDFKSCEFLLTCNLQCGIPADGRAHDVAGHALVHAAVHLLLAEHRPEEEQAPVRQQDPVRRGIIWSCPDWRSILVPVYDGLGVTTCLQIAELN